MPKRALICGVSGQDGAYLAELLLSKGYHVMGTSRDAQVASFANLTKLGIKDEIELYSMVQTDFRSTLYTLRKSNPDEIYNLAGQSSVSLSFEQPAETLESISNGVLNVLDAIRFLGREVKLYNASSGECYGDTNQQAADEKWPFGPRSPYAVAKTAAHYMVTNYRDAYGVFGCNGILFNHESPLRPARFVTKKIVAFACSKDVNANGRLRLGNLDICRDWGYAKEYVVAMWEMLQLDKPDDFVIATGVSHSLREFVEAVFSAVGRDYREHVETSPELMRPSEIWYSAGNPAKARDLLGWRANASMREVAKIMVEAQAL